MIRLSLKGNRGPIQIYMLTLLFFITTLTSFYLFVKWGFHTPSSIKLIIHTISIAHLDILLTLCLVNPV